MRHIIEFGVYIPSVCRRRAYIHRCHEKICHEAEEITKLIQVRFLELIAFLALQRAAVKIVVHETVHVRWEIPPCFRGRGSTPRGSGPKFLLSQRFSIVANEGLEVIDPLYRGIPGPDRRGNFAPVGNLVEGIVGLDPFPDVL